MTGGLSGCIYMTARTGKGASQNKTPRPMAAGGAKNSRGAPEGEGQRRGWHALMVFLEVFGPLLENPERIPLGVSDGRGHYAIGARDAYFRAKEAFQLGTKLIEQAEAQMRAKSGM